MKSKLGEAEPLTPEQVQRQLLTHILNRARTLIEDKVVHYSCVAILDAARYFQSRVYVSERSVNLLIAAYQEFCIPDNVRPVWWNDIESMKFRKERSKAISDFSQYLFDNPDRADTILRG